jgi:multidrug resistance efflux pump
LEEAQAEVKQTAFKVDRMNADVERARIELASAQKGVVVGDGFADVPYSQQRIDEVVLRLSNMKAELEALELNEREFRERFAAESKRLTTLQNASVSGPAAGLISSLRVADGARVSSGDLLAEFVDCSRSYVEATVPERGFAVVQPGHSVTVDLAGGPTAVPGTVRSLHGGSSGSAGKAARVDKTGLITVIVDVDLAQMGSSCQIGRSAKVSF